MIFLIVYVDQLLSVLTVIFIIGLALWLILFCINILNN